MTAVSSDLKLDHEVRRLLELHRSPEQWAFVSREAGVSLSWIIKYVQGVTANPRYHTLLRVYLVLNDKPVIKTERQIDMGKWLNAPTATSPQDA